MIHSKNLIYFNDMKYTLTIQSRSTRIHLVIVSNFKYGIISIFQVFFNLTCSKRFMFAVHSNFKENDKQLGRHMK